MKGYSEKELIIRSLITNIVCLSDKYNIDIKAILKDYISEFDAFDTSVTEEEISDGIQEDSLIYSKDGRKLLKAVEPNYSKAHVSIKFGVVTICDNCFRALRGYSSIKLPDTIKCIGKLGLACWNVSSIYVPSSVLQLDVSSFCRDMEIYVDSDNPNYSSENGVLYNKDKTVLIKVPKQTYLEFVPNGVKVIGSYAFGSNVGKRNIGDKSEISIHLPESIECIEECAFNYYWPRTLFIPRGSKERFAKMLSNDPYNIEKIHFLKEE